MRTFTLTIIIPLDLKRRPLDLIAKTIELVTHPDTEDYIFHIALNDRQRNYERKLISKLKERSNVKLFKMQSDNDSINMSELRNLAAKDISTKVSLLLDADLHPNKEIFDDCINSITTNKDNIIILPCLYLSKKGTNYLNKKSIHSRNLLDKFFNYNRMYFKQIAAPSSIVFFKSEDYWAVGGFDNKFENHGYEDFDFLLRLAIYHNLITYSEDFFDDITCRSPMLSHGFRKKLGHLCLPHLLDKKIIFHKFHKKFSEDDFYKKRKANYNYMKEKLTSFIANLEMERDSVDHQSLINELFIICKNKKINFMDFTILFDNRPGHIDRGESHLETIIRKTSAFLRKK